MQNEVSIRRNCGETTFSCTVIPRRLSFSVFHQPWKLKDREINIYNVELARFFFFYSFVRFSLPHSTEIFPPDVCSTFFPRVVFVSIPLIRLPVAHPSIHPPPPLCAAFTVTSYVEEEEEEEGRR